MKEDSYIDRQLKIEIVTKIVVENENLSLYQMIVNDHKCTGCGDHRWIFIAQGSASNGCLGRWSIIVDFCMIPVATCAEGSELKWLDQSLHRDP